MKYISKIITSMISLALCVLLCTSSAFAQDTTSESNSVSESNTVNTETGESSDFVYIKYYWKKESNLYKGFGWGFFGTGLILAISGTIVLATTIKEYNEKKDKADRNEGEQPNKIYYDEKARTGDILIGIGGAFTITGIALLIAEAVKFAPYRRDEVSGDFTWHPEIYASPEMTGIGIRAHF